MSVESGASQLSCSVNSLEQHHRRVLLDNAAFKHSNHRIHLLSLHIRALRVSRILSLHLSIATALLS